MDSSRIVDAFVIVLASAGAFFFIGGTIGLLRCPDLYSRLHPATKCDTLGSCLITIALALRIGLDLALFKLLAIILLLLVTSATAGHAIARSAFKSGIVPWHKEGVSPLPWEGLE